MKMDKHMNATYIEILSSKNPVQEEPLMAEMKTTAAFVFEVSFFFLTDVIKKS